MKDIGLLLLRLGFGGLMLPHGIHKLEKLFAGGEIKFADPFGLGHLTTLILVVLAEFLCAILIIIGFKVRWTSIPLLATMAVAVFIVHAGDPWNKKEFAVLYFVGYLVIFFLNSGKYSLDTFLKRR